MHSYIYIILNFISRHILLAFLTHPCRRQPLKIFFISNDRGRSLFEAFDWLLLCVDPIDVRDLRVKVVVEIETL